MDLHETLKKSFGFNEFRGSQKQVIENALNKQSSLVLMPTGYGKSLCYQMPAMILKETVLVISPLIALMQDQVSKAQQLGLRADFINSSISSQERSKRYEKLEKGQYQLLYVTPERFRKPEFISAIEKIKISLLVVDEAHCISQWGHDFRPDYSRVGEFYKFLEEPPVMALTATATPAVQVDIQKVLGAKNIQIFKEDLQRPNLAVKVTELVSQPEKLAQLAEDLKVEEPTIVYFSLINTLHEAAEALRAKGLKPVLYHGQLNPERRRQALKYFQTEENPLLLATPAFGLGIDRADIRRLIHFEMPGSIEAYFQEIGRAGRDGKPSHCEFYFDEDDVSIQMEFIKWSHPQPDFIQSVYRLIESNPDKIKAEGLDYMRGQLHFYNKRDFRLETSLNLLEHWEVIRREVDGRPAEILSEIPTEMLNPEACKLRERQAHERLLAMLRLAKQEEGCRLETIYEYFDLKNTGPCGKCDLCLKT